MRLGWFNEGSGAVLFINEKTEKTLFSVFSVFSDLVAGRVKSEESDQTVTFSREKVTKGDKRGLSVQLLTRLGWFNKGSVSDTFSS